MNRSVVSRLAIAATALTLVAASSAALAREGVQKTSIGNGLKCWQAAVVQADGSIKRQQVCGKYGV